MPIMCLWKKIKVTVNSGDEKAINAGRQLAFLSYRWLSRRAEEQPRGGQRRQLCRTDSKSAGPSAGALSQAPPGRHRRPTARTGQEGAEPQQSPLLGPAPAVLRERKTDVRSAHQVPALGVWFWDAVNESDE